jgi:hypothetical protein
VRLGRKSGFHVTPCVSTHVQPSNLVWVEVERK